MLNNKSVPIIFGVTGHRDLRSEDVQPLKVQVTQIFTEHQVKYPNTQLILLSALAEGADMLVAEVAQTLGVMVKAVLPYEKSNYLDSFSDAQAQSQFERIFKNTVQQETLECNSEDKGDCYEQLGKHIADNCNILIALFDGLDIGKQGGTSEVIKYMQAGNNNNRFDLLDGNALFTINTPRISNPDIDKALELNKEFLSSNSAKFGEVLEKIELLNIEFAKFSNENTNNTLISNACEFFDKAANTNQSAYKRHYKWILISSWLAFVSLETMYVLEMEWLTWGYGIGLLIATFVYQISTNKGKVQEIFTHFRGLAEALRVQDAWNHAKLDKNIANYYLTDEHNKFTWIKITIKNIAYLDATPFNLYNEKDYNETEWIKGQVAYFAKALDERKSKLEKWEQREHRLYKIGIITMSIMFLLFIAEHFVDFKTHWHYLISVSSICLVSAAFIGEKYLKIEGFEEELYEFEIMQKHFVKAKNLIVNEQKDSDIYHKMLFDLGVKALKENSKWVVLHDSRRAGFSVE